MGQVVLMFALLAVIYYVCMAAGLLSLAAVAATGHKLRKWARGLDFDFAGTWLPICLFIVLLKVVADLFGGEAVLALFLLAVTFPYWGGALYLAWSALNWLWKRVRRKQAPPLA